MKTPRRRERDETRKLPDMGKALGWGRRNYNDSTYATNDKQEYEAQLLQNVGAFDEASRIDRQGKIADSSVKTVEPNELERKKRNAREERRVEQTKSGFLAQSGSGWAESQAKGEKRPVVKIDSGK